MKQSKLILFIGVLFFLNFPIHAQKNTFKVMAWNILHGGNDIENGPENVGKIINEINPDIILMIETYGSGPYIRITHDDYGIPCIDICGSEGDIIFTVRPKEEVDLHNFVKDLG